MSAGFCGPRVKVIRSHDDDVDDGLEGAEVSVSVVRLKYTEIMLWMRANCGRTCRIVRI